MLPEDKRWAMGLTIGIVVFFVLVIMTGRIFLTDVDSDYILQDSGGEIEAKFTLLMLRNDSKTIPIQVNPPATTSDSLGKKTYLQREYIARNSLVTLQVRTPFPVVLEGGEKPESASLDVEILHVKVPSHRPVIVESPNVTAVKTTEIYAEDMDPRIVHSGTVELGSEFNNDLWSGDYSARFRQDIFSFSGGDDFWQIQAYDSIQGRTETYDGMALFKLRIRLTASSETEEWKTGWMETNYFAIDLVEPPG